MSTESYVKLRKLTKQDGEPIEDILRRGVDQLRGLGEKATIHLRLIRGGSTSGGSTVARSIYSLGLTPAGAFLQTESVAKPTLVVITTSEAFQAMVEGSYSPVEAYLSGAMMLLGNVDLGKKIILHLAGSGTQAGVCPMLINESWAPNGLGGGSLTVSGEFFTRGGTVDIHYDWGGGFYRRIIVADSNGDFTVTEGLPCGDIPGHPGVGVIVTAFDLSSGLNTKDYSYATPC
jgi:hypothetical protein